MMGDGLDDIRRQLKRIAASLSVDVGDGPADVDEFPYPRPDRLTTAIAWMHARDARNRAFGAADIFHEPAWNILLDLYVAHCRGKPVSVSSASIAAQVPPTTALRWITVLEQKGMVVRLPDRLDRRRILLALSDDAISRVEAALDGAVASDKRLGLARLQALQ